MWKALDPEAIAWHAWDDEVVVYDEATGDTHHLAPLAGHVLRVLLQAASGMDMPSLTASVVAAFQMPQEVLAQELDRALTELVRLELATPNPD